MQAAIRGVSGDSGLCDFVIFRGIVQSHEALIENSETTVSVSELVGVPVQDTEGQYSTVVTFIPFTFCRIVCATQYADESLRHLLILGAVLKVLQDGQSSSAYE